MLENTEWFNKRANVCYVCKSTPVMVPVANLSQEKKTIGYQVFCEKCRQKWGEEFTTSMCKTPSNAIKSWNRKMERMKEEEDKLFKCPYCGCTDLFIQTTNFKSLYCEECGRWIKLVNDREQDILSKIREKPRKRETRDLRIEAPSSKRVQREGGE